MSGINVTLGNFNLLSGVVFREYCDSSSILAALSDGIHRRVVVGNSRPPFYVQNTFVEDMFLFRSYWYSSYCVLKIATL
jgi:hypothetical protein